MTRETARKFEQFSTPTVNEANEEGVESAPPSSLVPLSTVVSYTSSAPELYSPFRGRSNPHMYEAATHSSQWVLDVGIVGRDPSHRRFEGSKFAALSALAY